ncbi:3348_t:CDS:1, partial [Paraglomus brasilianum]
IDDDDDAICFMQSPSSQCIIVCTKSAEGYEEVITPTEREDG